MGYSFISIPRSALCYRVGPGGHRLFRSTQIVGLQENAETISNRQCVTYTIRCQSTTLTTVPKLETTHCNRKFKPAVNGSLEKGCCLTALDPAATIIVVSQSVRLWREGSRISFNIIGAAGGKVLQRSSSQRATKSTTSIKDLSFKGERKRRRGSCHRENGQSNFPFSPPPPLPGTRIQQPTFLPSFSLAPSFDHGGPNQSAAFPLSPSPHFCRDPFESNFLHHLPLVVIITGPPAIIFSRGRIELANRVAVLGERHFLFMIHCFLSC